MELKVQKEYNKDCGRYIVLKKLFLDFSHLRSLL